MPYKKVSGIYEIRNLKNNKVYIGSAINLKNRLATHKRLLLTNKHFNTHLQSSFNKHGIELFGFKIIELCSIECLLDREDYWIAEYSAANKQFGYNKRLKAENNLGLTFSDETKRKLSLSHIGHKRSEEAHKKIIKSQYKKVCQLDKLGNLLATFESMIEAEENTGMPRQNISATCRNQIKSCGGYYWCYEKDLKTFKIKTDGRFKTNI